jgi:hypothetical protein
VGKDFRSYSASYKATRPEEKAGQADVKNMTRGDLTDAQRRDYDRIRAAAGKYENKSEDELTAELMKKVAESKRDGTFNPAEIERFAAQLGPMLGKEQNEKLQGLLRTLRGA